MTERADVKGHHFENWAVYVYRLANDEIVEVHTLDRDRSSAAAFWKSVDEGEQA